MAKNNVARVWVGAKSVIHHRRKDTKRTQLLRSLTLISLSLSLLRSTFCATVFQWYLRLENQSQTLLLWPALDTIRRCLCRQVSVNALTHPFTPRTNLQNLGTVWEYSIEKIDFKSIPHNVAVLAKVNGKWTTW
ncbi:hypothetical protein SCY_2149 [Saccharomyces cerevisiae YJM789]|uniref:Uncharacterized protein n=1 Tax=Saccharomyces cerevisiae (strain YJM789) TaxID=307796 RepID=A6ZUR6_YEAS7|nr:hypothetical protein SCY_2149 [Saccharomyces cerevisiae YJM789]